MPLHLACLGTMSDQVSLEVVKTLIYAYPEATAKFTNRGYLPLHYALSFVQAETPQMRNIPTELSQTTLLAYYMLTEKNVKVNKML